MKHEATLPVETWSIDKLTPCPRNEKKHPPEQIEKLKRSIKRLGIANPPNIKPSGEIITGHGRWMAATELGWKSIPVIVRIDLTDQECDALRISDNQTVSNDYDTQLLHESMVNLHVEGFDMDVLGMDTAEIEKMTTPFGDLDESAFVEDISAAVETQKDENEKKQAEIDGTAAPVTDALGFKRLSIEQSRKVRGFMTDIERSTGKSGADALVTYIDGLAA